jgi:hypothetical protein
MSCGNVVGVCGWRGASHVVADRAKRPTLKDGTTEPLPTCGLQSGFEFGPGRNLVERAARRSIRVERPRRFGVAWFGLPRSASVFLGNVGHIKGNTPRANWCPPFGRLGGVRCRHRSAAWVVLTWSKVGPAPVTCNVQTKRVFNMVVLASHLDTKKPGAVAGSFVRGACSPCAVPFPFRHVDARRALNVFTRCGWLFRLAPPHAAGCKVFKLWGNATGFRCSRFDDNNTIRHVVQFVPIEVGDQK